jgi:hypothetical protein
MLGWHFTRYAREYEERDWNLGWCAVCGKLGGLPTSQNRKEHRNKTAQKEICKGKVIFDFSRKN